MDMVNTTGQIIHTTRVIGKKINSKEMENLNGVIIESTMEIGPTI